jgi:hypothetical protein
MNRKALIAAGSALLVLSMAITVGQYVAVARASAQASAPATAPATKPPMTAAQASAARMRLFAANLDANPAAAAALDNEIREPSFLPALLKSLNSDNPKLKAQVTETVTHIQEVGIVVALRKAAGECSTGSAGHLLYGACGQCRGATTYYALYFCSMMLCSAGDIPACWAAAAAGAEYVTLCGECDADGDQCAICDGLNRSRPMQQPGLVQ